MSPQSAVLSIFKSPGRWHIYQRERFPILAHGALIAAFSFCGVSYSSLLRDRAELPAPGPALVAFFTSFLLFLQLRIADEFKDFEEDARYRPCRPVPRGLVSLRELGTIGVAAGLIQLGLSLWLKFSLALVLVLIWSYLALMSKEFFVRDWLKARPVTYMWTHMLIMPLIDAYTTACDWLVAGADLPEGLQWLLLVSFFNGIVVEIGRKICAPQDEEHGVETYSFLWGPRNAALVWLAALAATAFGAWKAAGRIGFAGPVAWLLALLLAVAGGLAWRFLDRPEAVRARLLEHMSGLWTLLMYLSLGAVPLLLRL